MQELPNEFEWKFECLGENTGKYKTFSVPIESIDNDGNEKAATISYKIKFIDSARFMTTSSSNLVDSLTEGIRKIN